MSEKMTRAEHDMKMMEINLDMQEAMNEGDNFRFLALQQKRNMLVKRWELENPRPVSSSSSDDTMPCSYFIFLGIALVVAAVVAWFLANR